MLVEQQVHILAGASGAGKSTLLTGIIKQWANNEPTLIPSLAIPPDVQQIVWVAADRGGEAHRRFTGTPTTKVLVLDLVSDLTFEQKWFRSGQVLLAKVLERVPPDCKFIVLDPIAPFLTGRTNDYRDVMISLITLGRIAATRNLTILATHHTTKARSDFTFVRPQDAISGSSAFLGYSGTQMVLVSPEECKQPYARFIVVAHEGRPIEYQLTRKDDGSFTDYITLEGYDTTILVKILEAIPSGTHSTKDMLRLLTPLGISRTTIFKVLASLVKEGMLSRGDRGSYVKS